MRFIPAWDDQFFVRQVFVHIFIVKDASGKITAMKGWESGREFVAKRIEK